MRSATRRLSAITASGGAARASCRRAAKRVLGVHRAGRGSSAGTRLRGVSTSPTDFNAQIIDEFHANAGHVGGMFEGTPLLLLHHTGAKSGKSRINPLAYQADGGRYVVFASKAGAPTNPDWYHNLKADPNVTIEVGTETIPVLASEASGEERERLYRTQVERVPQFGEYQQKAGRVIPVLVLTPTGGG